VAGVGAVQDEEAPAEHFRSALEVVGDLEDSTRRVGVPHVEVPALGREQLLTGEERDRLLDPPHADPLIEHRRPLLDVRVVVEDVRELDARREQLVRRNRHALSIERERRQRRELVPVAPVLAVAVR
jgi:hypothetical protein